MEHAPWAAPAAPSPSSASAPGSSAPTGATSARPTPAPVLEAAVEEGVTFFDTADVYGDGRSETGHRRLPRRPPGRRGHGRDQDGPPGRPGAGELRASTTSAPGPTGRGATSASTPSTSCSCTARPTRCTPTTRCYDALDTLVADGAVAALRRQRREGRAGAGRDRPAARRDRADHRQRLPAQAARGGASPRPPRTGRRHHRPGAAGLRPPVRQVRRGTTFADDDHRTFNRDGEAFDVGETFSGRRLRDRGRGRPGVQRAGRGAGARGHHARPGGASRGSGSSPACRTVIPGARNVEQARGNAARRRRTATSARRSTRACAGPLRRAPPGAASIRSGDGTHGRAMWERARPVLERSNGHSERLAAR